MRTLCSSTLIGEALLILFAGLVAMQLSDVPAGTIWTVSGIAIAVAGDMSADAKHSVSVDGRTLTWAGPVGRLDLAKTGAKK